MFVQHAFTLVTMQPPLMTIYQCLWMLCVQVFAGLLQGCLAIMLGLERLHATVTKAFTDPNKSSRGVKLVLGVLWLLAFSGTGAIVLRDRGQDQHCNCTAGFGFFKSPQMPVGMPLHILVPPMAMATIAGTSHWLVYYLSKRLLMKFGLNTARHSLNERYQLWANRKTAAILLPTATHRWGAYVIARILLRVCI